MVEEACVKLEIKTYFFSKDELLSSDLASRKWLKTMFSSTRSNSYGLFCKANNVETAQLLTQLK